MRILHVNTSDLGGGAERVASDLCRAGREAGHRAWLAVGRRLGEGEHVLPLSGGRAGGRRRGFRTPGAPSGSARRRLVRAIADPLGLLERLLGHEDFRHPASRGLFDLLDPPPDVIHLHNLHGGYFDLRLLPRLCRRAPVFVTLHDPWMITGHCAHPFDCARWSRGCGRCPDLEIYPAIRRDATAFNWRRKQSIYRESRLRLATPSRWLMERVERSMLAPARVEARVIPNGVDLEVFHPGDRQAARQATGLPPDSVVVLFVSNGLVRSRFRDFRTLAEAIERIAASGSARPPCFVALGERPAEGAVVRAPIRFVPYESDPRRVASHYRAADLLVHATRADTFPNVVLEAGACGIPVVASAVGGIPEQIESGVSGELVAEGDPSALAAAVERLARDDSRRREMGVASARRVAERFDLRRAAQTYLDWYERALAADGADAALPPGDRRDPRRSRASAR